MKTNKPKFFKKKTLVTITYCEGDKIHFPAKVAVVEIPGRGGVNAVDVEHFAKSYCYKHGWLLTAIRHKVVDRGEE